MAGTVALTGGTEFTTAPSDQGDTIIQNSPTSADFNSQSSIQADASFFIELHDFVNLTAALHGLPPRAIVSRMIQMLQDMFIHPNQ